MKECPRCAHQHEDRAVCMKMFGAESMPSLAYQAEIGPVGGLEGSDITLITGWLCDAADNTSAQQNCDQYQPEDDQSTSI